MTNFQTLSNIQGLTAVITGGSGQLGRVMAQGLAQAGVRVAVLSLHVDTSEKLAKAIRTEGGQAIGVACDVLVAQQRDVGWGIRAFLVTHGVAPSSRPSTERQLPAPGPVP